MTKTLTIHMRSGNRPATADTDADRLVVTINGTDHVCTLTMISAAAEIVPDIIYHDHVVPATAKSLRGLGIDPARCIILYTVAEHKMLVVSASEDIEVLAPLCIEAMRAKRALWDRQREAEERAEATRRSITLSTRGWGDYASVVWTGDITRPAAEIEAECAALLAAATDVDTPLDAAAISAAVAKAKSEAATAYAARMDALRARIAKAEALGDKIRTAAAQAEWERRYNDAVNEGGDGFVPHQTTIEELASYRAELARLSRINPYA